MSGLPVETLDQRSLTITTYEVANQSTTRGNITPIKSALGVEIGYFSTASATGKYLYVVFNAYSNADAAAKLGTAGQRFVIPIGEVRKFNFPASAPCTRVDFLSDTAETGTSKTIVTIGA